jgi:hypothetical protein
MLALWLQAEAGAAAGAASAKAEAATRVRVVIDAICFISESLRNYLRANVQQKFFLIKCGLNGGLEMGTMPKNRPKTPKKQAKMPLKFFDLGLFCSRRDNFQQQISS